MLGFKAKQSVMVRATSNVVKNSTLNVHQYRGSMLLFKLLVLFGLAISGSACEQVSYYRQAVMGHFAIMTAREDIDKILASDHFNGETLDKELRHKFLLLRDIKQFAKQEMLLPADKGYRHYVDLGRDSVVFNVVAAPEFSMEPYQWCYLVIGCANYRGYFAKQDAVTKADQLKSQGLDVAVRGASAYSTLGYFNDPVLNTFIDSSDVHLAALIFHELAHQVIYIKNDTTFNESFAKAVEIEALRRWLLAQNQEQDFLNYMADAKSRNYFLDLNASLINSLSAMYQLQLSDTEKRAQKVAIFNVHQQQFLQALEQDNALEKYRNWFEGEPNNAKLNSLADYYKLQKHFQHLMDESTSVSAFYKTVEKLGKMKKADRDHFFEHLPIHQGS